MNIHTISARMAAALVATIAGAASWEHIASVAAGAGERPWVAYSLPAAIDGLILVGVAALLEDKRADRTGRLSARLAIVTGVVATLAANVASAEPTTTARLVAIAAPVSFLLSVEVLTRTGRARSTPVSRDVRTDHQRKPAGRKHTTRDKVAAAIKRTPGTTPAQVAAKLKISERTAQRHWPTPPVETVSANGGQSA